MATQARAVIGLEELGPRDMAPVGGKNASLGPSAALRWWRLPIDGVALARWSSWWAMRCAYPVALLRPEALDPATRAKIDAPTRGHAGPSWYFVDALSRGMSRIAAFCHPCPVIVRMSSFKTNEYARRRIGA